MLGVKTFVSETIHALNPVDLQTLADTLRIDLRGCEDRKDIERILTGLLALDENSSLGVFISWLRTSEQKSVVTTKPQFENTFVPKCYPLRPTKRLNHNSPSKSPLKNQEQDVLPEIPQHHISAEIATLVATVETLEKAFKDAEREVHGGVPTFQKMKHFLMCLTRLRKRETELRQLLLLQSNRLVEEHEAMKVETLDTRDQLDFFMEGFTNLRLRHDNLVDISTKMQAENETAQDVFAIISATESHFSAFLQQQYMHQFQKAAIEQLKVERCQENIAELQRQLQVATDKISVLTSQRDDARKDAACVRRQLRRVKRRVRNGALEDPQCSYFAAQSQKLKKSLVAIAKYYKDKVVGEIVKSGKPIGSRLILQELYQAVLPVPPDDITSLDTHRSISNAWHPDAHKDVPKLVYRVRAEQQDISEVVSGVLLLGESHSQTERLAQVVAQRQGYLPMNLSELIREIEISHQDQLALSSTTGIVPTIETTDTDQGILVEDIIDPRTLNAPETEEMTLDQMETSATKHKSILQNSLLWKKRDASANGVLFYGQVFSVKLLNLLISMGFPLSTVIYIKGGASISSSPSRKAQVSSPVDDSINTKDQVRQSSGASPSKTSTSRSEVRSTAAKGKGVTSKTGRPVTTSPTVKSIDQLVRVLGKSVHKLEASRFEEDCITSIESAIASEYRQKCLPYIQWDSTTQAMNETLRMWFEDMTSCMIQQRDLKAEATEAARTTATRASKPGTETTAPASQKVSNRDAKSRPAPRIPNSSQSGVTTPKSGKRPERKVVSTSPLNKAKGRK